VNLESLLHPASILLVIGFICGLASPQFQNRHKMMFCKFLADGFTGLYLITLGGISGGCAALIAATGALIQSLTPHKHLRKTIWLRMIVALVLSAASIYFVYQHPLDLLPITMVIACRFGELQPEAKRIKMVYFLTSFPWMIYYFMNAFYLPLFVCIIGSMSLLVGIIRHQYQSTEETKI
jgi:uncharacterized ion transporter superfamily protein YfcC